MFENLEKLDKRLEYSVYIINAYINAYINATNQFNSRRVVL